MTAAIPFIGTAYHVIIFGMGQFKLFSFIVTLLLLSSCSSTGHQSPIVGSQFPFAKFTMLNGEVKPLDDWRGRPVIVMFWSADCGSCERSINRLNEEALPLLRKSKVVFIADNVDPADQLRTVQKRIKEWAFTWPLHSFSGNDMSDEAFVTFQGTGVPFFVMLDSAGRVVNTAYNPHAVIDFLKKTRQR